jgi:hypothetical protein
MQIQRVANVIDTPEIMLQILGIHIIPGAVKAADLSDGQVVTTMNGEQLTVSVKPGTITFTAPDGGMVGTVIKADIMSCKGVVHIIDMVLIPGDVPAPEPEEPEKPAPEPEEPEKPSPEPEEPEKPAPEPEEPEKPAPEPEEPEKPAPAPEEPAPAPEETCPSILDLVAGTPELSTLGVALEVCSFSRPCFQA